MCKLRACVRGAWLLDAVEFFEIVPDFIKVPVRQSFLNSQKCLDCEYLLC